MIKCAPGKTPGRHPREQAARRKPAAHFCIHRSRTTGGSAPARCLMASAECLIPDARCPMPHARCPMPDARCPMPDARCPMPDAFRRLCARASDPDRCPPHENRQIFFVFSNPPPRTRLRGRPPRASPLPHARIIALVRTNAIARPSVGARDPSHRARPVKGGTHAHHDQSGTAPRPHPRRAHRHRRARRPASTPCCTGSGTRGNRSSRTPRCRRAARGRPRGSAPSSR